MAKLNSLEFAALIINSLQENLRRLAKLHLYELDQRISLDNKTPLMVMQQMQHIANAIQNLKQLYGDNYES